MNLKNHPIWLRRLDLVKKEFQATRWPKGEEGFQQGMALMALGLEALEKRNRILRWDSDRVRFRRAA